MLRLLRRGSDRVEYVRGNEVGSLYLENSMIERTEGEGFGLPASGRSLLALLVAALLSAALPGMATAQDQADADEPAEDSNRLSVSTILDWENVGDAQISPDGSQIVYTRRWVDQLEDDWQSALWIMNSDGSRQRFLAKGSSPRWSPDGTRAVLLRFNEEYHGTTSKPSNVMRTALYLMSWFEKWGTFDGEDEKVAGTNR